MVLDMAVRETDKLYQIPGHPARCLVCQRPVGELHVVGCPELRGRPERLADVPRYRRADWLDLEDMDAKTTRASEPSICWPSVLLATMAGAAMWLVAIWLAWNVPALRYGLAACAAVGAGFGFYWIGRGLR